MGKHVLKSVLGLLLCLLLSAPAWALFCVKCGMELPDTAKFCNQCGTKVIPPKKEKSQEDSEKKIKSTSEDKKKSDAEPDVVARKAKEKPVTLAKGLTYRVKADLFIYERRGDEHNILKKNLFFKPRRYKLPRDAEFKILEVIGNSYLIQSLPNKDGHTVQGWVTFEELGLRSDFKK